MMSSEIDIFVRQLRILLKITNEIIGNLKNGFKNNKNYAGPIQHVFITQFFVKFAK